MTIGLEILNPSRCLFGIEYETLYISDEVDEKGHPIIEQHKVFSIGLVFITIVISANQGSIHEEGDN